MVAGYRRALRARFQDSDAGMKMAFAQHVLFIVVRHHAGHFAGTAPYTLLAVGHNKTIHNDTCFWFNNLILYRNIVFTHGGAIRQCTNAQEAELSPVNLWQINFFQEAVL
jgi:hypothetical protein